MLPILRKGMRGDAVRIAKRLMEHTDTHACFDDAFRAFVKEKQKALGLKSDGVIGEKTWKAAVDAALGPEEERQKPVDYRQYDPKWADVMYSACGDRKQTIRTSGCGPTAMADVVATLKDASVTPPVLAEKALAWGDRTKKDGTAWRFFDHAAEEYGFMGYRRSAKADLLLSCLDKGGLAVASMGKGFWTKGGHYICVWKIEDGYVYACDPASAKRTRQRTEDFMKEHKMFFLFSK